MALYSELKDNSFYKMVFSQTKSAQMDMTKDIISLTIDEKMGGMTQGSLQLYDPDYQYSRILRPGVNIKLSFGYKKFGLPLSNILALDADEIRGKIVRRGLRCVVISPSGGGSASGLKTYNCNFMATGWRGLTMSRSFDNVPKRVVITQLLSEMGIPPTNQYIDFDQQSEVAKGVFQSGISNFKMVRDLSKWWDALFFVNYTPLGVPAAAFISPRAIGKNPYTSLVLGAAGNVNNLYYSYGDQSNVISYTWKDSFGNSGIGDGVRIEIINGQPTLFRYVAETQQVVTWKLDRKAIQGALEKQGAHSGISGQTKLLFDWLSFTTWPQAKKFFKRNIETTAPQGYGYSMNVDMLGNPLTMPSNKVKFKKGFPDFLAGNRTQFFIENVVHNFTSDGYRMKLKVVDGLTLFGFGAPIV